MQPATTIPKRSPPAAPGFASDLAPPLSLPGTHFGFALLCWVLGALGVIWVAPLIAAGDFADGRLLGITHLFTLGWISTSIMGALYQLLPVALGVPIRSPRIAYFCLALYAPGLIAFLMASVGGWTGWILPAALAFGTGLILFAGNLGATLWQARDRGITWWALFCAGASLIITILFGAALSGNLRWGFLGAERLGILTVHIHVAVAGWVLLVMLGIGHKLLPMFLLSHGTPEWPAKLALALLGPGVLLLIVAHHALILPVRIGAALLIGGGVLAFTLQVALFYRTRIKRALDPGMRLAAAACAFLPLALLLAPLFLWYGTAAPRIATAYILVLILGGPSLFVAGHYYKILPFLIWYHRFGPLAGRRPLPKVSDLYSARPATLTAMLLPLGVIGLAGSTLGGNAIMARSSALLFASGALILTFQMWGISRRRPLP